MIDTAALTPERVLRRLEWRVLRRLDGRLQGDYRTVFRGAGVDVADLREYQYGDDLRHIDWNVTARTDITHVREYVEDREVTAWLLLDASASMEFGPIERRKHLVLTEVAATVAQLLSAGQPGRRPVLRRPRRETIPPGNGRNHVLRILARMLGPDARPPRRASPTWAWRCAPRCGILRRRSLVVIVSDFLSEPGWQGLLSQLARRHDVVAIQVVDRREFELPAAGMIYVEDAETGEVIFVDTDDPGFQQRLREQADERQATLVADAVGRARPVHGVDRRGPRARAVPDLPAAQAAAPMRELAAEPWADLRLALDAARARRRSAGGAVVPQAAARPRGAACAAGHARPRRGARGDGRVAAPPAARAPAGSRGGAGRRVWRGRRRPCPSPAARAP